jgi:hypothetical protein
MVCLFVFRTHRHFCLSNSRSAFKALNYPYLYYAILRSVFYMQYRLKSQRSIIAILFFLSYFGLGFGGKSVKPSLRIGYCISAAINAHGSISTNKTANSSGRDQWWSCTVLSDDLIYSVESRENPSKIGLVGNAGFQFYELKNWIYVPRPKGKPIALKILNKSKKK